MKKNISLMLVVLLGLSWYMAVDTYFGTPKEYQEHIENAQAYEQKEIYEDAIVEYESAQSLLQTPDIQLDLSIAHAYLAMNESSDYLSKMESIIKSYEVNTEAVIELAGYYCDDKKIPKAVQLLKREHGSHPEDEVISQKLDSLKGTYTSVYAKYLDMTRIVNGYSVVQTEDGYGIINTNGASQISSNYEAVGIFGSKIPYAPVKENGKWSYINSQIHKKLVPDIAYDTLTFFSEGKATASRNGKYGYLNEELEEICEFEYEDATLFGNGVAAVKKNGKWAIIDDSFHTITDFKYDDVKRDEYGYCSYNKRIFVKSGTEYQMITTEGEVVAETSFEDAYPFVAADQMAAVKCNGKWGYINDQGEIMIACTYEEAKSFSIDYAAVKQGDAWGYIDTENKLVIPCEFSETTPFYKNGTAAVKVADQWQMIKLNIYQDESEV